MRWTLRHAYERVPHHKLAFDAARVHPDDFESLDDLARFPFTTRQHLRDTYPFALFAVPRERLARIHASATTGKPTVVGYTQKDIDISNAVLARSLRAAGVRPGWIVHIAHGQGVRDGVEKYGCAVMPIPDGQTRSEIQLIADFKPEVIMATPSAMLALLDQFRAAGADPRKTPFKLGIFGAEPCTQAMRAAIEDGFDMHAVTIWASSEIMAAGAAQECVQTKDGLTIWEDHFYPEIINPRTGRILRDGEEGELALTSLTREAMPVIRYRTGDTARLLPGTARTMRRLSFGRPPTPSQARQTAAGSAPKPP